MDLERVFASVFPGEQNAYSGEKLQKLRPPVFCNNCENPPCVCVCSTGATFQRPDGIVMMDSPPPVSDAGCAWPLAPTARGVRITATRDHVSLNQSGLSDPFQRRRGKMQFLVRSGHCERCLRLRGGVLAKALIFRRRGESPLGNPASFEDAFQPAKACTRAPARRFTICYEDAMLEKLYTVKPEVPDLDRLLDPVGCAGFFHLRQLDYGLGITGMSRDVSWGSISPSLPFWWAWLPGGHAGAALLSA